MTNALAVVGRLDQFEDLIGKMREVVTVSQIVLPSLAIVDSQEFPDIPGVTFYTGGIPETVLESLTEPERLFVRAWLQHGRDKERPGDRMPWDAPGFTPPA